MTYDRQTPWAEKDSRPLYLIIEHLLPAKKQSEVPAMY